MSDLMRLVSERLSGEAIDKIAQQVDADRGQTERGIAAALPALVSAVSRKGSDEEGARALEQSLDEDRDRSVFEKASAFVGRGVLEGELASLTGDGGSQGLLDRLLGNKQHPVAEGVHKASGLDVEQSMRLLRMLAPLVMGGLAKMKRDLGLDAGGLKSLLQDEGRQIDEGVQARGGQSGGLSALLGRDDDGAISDDVSKLTGLFDQMREAR